VAGGVVVGTETPVSTKAVRGVKRQKREERRRRSAGRVRAIGMYGQCSGGMVYRCDGWGGWDAGCGGE